MNLLLLLSALLSALTGVGASVPAPERAQAVAAASIARSAVATVRTTAVSRLATPLPALEATAPLGVAPIAVVRGIPAWIDRRRE